MNAAIHIVQGFKGYSNTVKMSSVGVVSPANWDLHCILNTHTLRFGASFIVLLWNINCHVLLVEGKRFT